MSPAILFFHKFHWSSASNSSGKSIGAPPIIPFDSLHGSSYNASGVLPIPSQFSRNSCGKYARFPLEVIFQCSSEKSFRVLRGISQEFLLKFIRSSSGILASTNSSGVPPAIPSDVIQKFLESSSGFPTAIAPKFFYRFLPEFLQNSSSRSSLRIPPRRTSELPANSLKFYAWFL